MKYCTAETNLIDDLIQKLSFVQKVKAQYSEYFATFQSGLQALNLKKSDLEISRQNKQLWETYAYPIIGELTQAEEKLKNTPWWDVKDKIEAKSIVKSLKAELSNVVLRIEGWETNANQLNAQIIEQTQFRARAMKAHEILSVAIDAENKIIKKLQLLTGLNSTSIHSFAIVSSLKKVQAKDEYWENF